MSIEAMKQALEALVEFTGWQSLAPRCVWDEAIASITFLRKAIQEEALRNVQRIGQEIEQEESLSKRLHDAGYTRREKLWKKDIEQDWSTQEAALESLREHMARIKELEAQIQRVRDVHSVQTQEGCWDVSEYMCGLSNGLELAVSILEDRDPQYKDLQKQEHHEPVAWIDSTGHPKHLRHIQSSEERRLYGELQPLYLHTQPKQEHGEPVAYIRVSKTGNVMACAKTDDFYALPNGTLLYTHPQPKHEHVY